MFWIGVIAWLICGLVWAVMLQVVESDLEDKSRYQKIEDEQQVQLS